LKARIIAILNYPKELLTKSKSLIYRYTVYTPQEEMKTILLGDKDSRLETLRKVFGIDKYKRIMQNAEIFIKNLKAKNREFEIRIENLDRKNIEKIIANQYDIVLNGWELASGGIRNHNPKALESVFSIMGYKKEEIKEKFGHMMEAFSFGAPPHGGIAPGIDRIITLLQNEPNIREVVAFPKTGDGRDLMMGAPSEVGKKQLEELHIQVKSAKPSKKRIKKILKKV
jgi:aspartyl/asparaginyl-tRNA synthetase